MGDIRQHRVYITLKVQTKSFILSFCVKMDLHRCHRFNAFFLLTTLTYCSQHYIKFCPSVWKWGLCLFLFMALQTLLFLTIFKYTAVNITWSCKYATLHWNHKHTDTKNNNNRSASMFVVSTLSPPRSVLTVVFWTLIAGAVPGAEFWNKRLKFLSFICWTVLVEP